MTSALDVLNQISETLASLPADPLLEFARSLDPTFTQDTHTLYLPKILALEDYGPFGPPYWVSFQSVAAPLVVKHR